MKQHADSDEQGLDEFTSEELEEARRYSMLIAWSPEDGLFLVESPELPAVKTHGATHEEAMAMGEEAIATYLWSLRRMGRQVPLPRYAMASG